MPRTQIDASDFTPKERELIRREFQAHFGGQRQIADGVMVRRWATGPNKGHVKFPAAVQTMLDRGLMTFADDGKMWPAVHFTDAGWRALRRLAEDPRTLPPDKFQHLIDELSASGRGR